MWSCRDSCDSLGELTDVVTSYFSFCVDTVLPVKKSKVFPNDKLSVSKGLNEKWKTSMWKTSTVVPVPNLHHGLGEGRSRYSNKLHTLFVILRSQNPCQSSLPGHELCL